MLNEKGRASMKRIRPFVCDTDTDQYYSLGECLGGAYKAGKVFK